MTQKELEHIASQKNILKTTIDKDWVLGHFLNAFYSSRENKMKFIFKGGTCLKKCYFEDYRFSEDLDFTLLDSNFILDTGFLKMIIEKSKEISDIRYYISEIKEQYHNDVKQGYEVKIKYWGADHKPNTPIPHPDRWQTYVKLDISFSERMILEPFNRKIFHPYSDSSSINETIPVYPMVEIIAEKVRSLIQRNRPRDIYDIWYVMNSREKPDEKDIQPLLFQKAESKGITISNIEQFVNEQKFKKNKRAWENSLIQHMPVNALPDFETVYSQLKIIINRILNV